MKTSEILDNLEEILIEAILPSVREMKKVADIGVEERDMARNLLSKVGTRIAFGKEVFDKSLTH